MSRKMINDAEVRSGQIVSGQAKNIIFYITSAICTDPGPKWKKTSYELEEVKKQTFEKLPGYFKEMATSEKVKGEITTFDALHWLSRNLAKICPIQKD